MGKIKIFHHFGHYKSIVFFVFHVFLKYIFVKPLLPKFREKKYRNSSKKPCSVLTLHISEISDECSELFILLVLDSSSAQQRIQKSPQGRGQIFKNVISYFLLNLKNKNNVGITGYVQNFFFCKLNIANINLSLYVMLNTSRLFCLICFNMYMLFFVVNAKTMKS